jgi:hypothetical protein
MARSRRPTPLRQEIEVEVDGKTYSGTDAVDDGSMTVYYGADSKTTQLGGSAGAPHGLARLLLRELVAEARRWQR